MFESIKLWEIGLFEIRLREAASSQKTTAPMQRSSQFLRRMLTVFLERTAPASMKAKPHCMKKMMVESERRKKSSSSMASILSVRARKGSKGLGMMVGVADEKRRRRR